MLLVSWFPQEGDGGSATRARARLNCAAAVDVDPRVATKPWHTDCVFADRAPSALGAGSNGARLRICSAKISRANRLRVLRPNFRGAGSLTELTFETLAVDTDVD